jgi:4-hydroxyacetophenone monooxygenase
MVRNPGLLAGIRLKAARIPFTIIEKNAGVGGTWWQNTYPGARADVGDHFYCHSFEPTDQCTHYFAEQPELQSYLQRVLEKYDIGRHVLWGTEVIEASWDESSATWTVWAGDRSGVITTLSARALISAVASRKCASWCGHDRRSSIRSTRTRSATCTS